MSVSLLGTKARQWLDLGLIEMHSLWSPTDKLIFIQCIGKTFCKRFCLQIKATSPKKFPGPPPPWWNGVERWKQVAASLNWWGTTRDAAGQGTRFILSFDQISWPLKMEGRVVYLLIRVLEDYWGRPGAHFWRLWIAWVFLSEVC